LALAVLLLLVSCGGEGTTPTGSTGTGSTETVHGLGGGADVGGSPNAGPAGGGGAPRGSDSPTPEEKIAYYLSILEGGDLDQFEWARDQLRRAGPAAVRPMAAALVANLLRNPAYAQNIAQTFDGWVPPDGAIDELIAAAKCERGETRMYAAAALGRTGSPEAVAPLLDLACDPAMKVALAAVDALDRIGSEDGARGLMGRLSTVLNTGVRGKVVPVIARHLPEKEAREFLIRLLKDEDLERSLSAAYALEDRDDRAAVDEIWDRYSKNPEDPRSLFLVVFLGNAGDERILPRLLEMARSGNPTSALTAAQLLANFRGPEVAAALKALTRSPSNQLRHEALLAWNLTGDPEARRAAFRMLGDPESQVRFWAANTLGALADPATSDKLVAVLADEDTPSVMSKISAALQLIGKPETAVAVVRALARETESDPGLAVLAENCAGVLTGYDVLGEDALALLYSLADSEKTSVRKAVVRVLAKHGREPERTRLLKRMLEDPDPGVRAAVLDTWLWIPGAEVEPVRAAFEKERNPGLVDKMSRLTRRLAYRWTE
jgi:HEAT repeat protein